MQVILQKTVSQLGMVGDVVDVAPGYFRNYLGPQGIALIANPKSIGQIEHHKKIIEAKKAKEKVEALKVKEGLEAAQVKIVHAAGSAEKLFGSVTQQEIVARLKEAGFLVDRRYLLMEAPLKTVGKHVVKVKLHPEVTADVTIEVEGKVTQTKTAPSVIEEPHPKKAPKRKRDQVKLEAMGEDEPEVSVKTERTEKKKKKPPKGHKT